MINILPSPATTRLKMTNEELYHPVEQPDDIPTRDREDAMGAYLMMFAALAAGLPLPIINLIAALIYYFTNRAKSRFIEFHHCSLFIPRFQLPF